MCNITALKTSLSWLNSALSVFYLSLLPVFALSWHPWKTWKTNTNLEVFGKNSLYVDDSLGPNCVPHWLTQLGVRRLWVVIGLTALCTSCCVVKVEATLERYVLSSCGALVLSVLWSAHNPFYFSCMMSDIVPNPRNHCSSLFSYHPAERASISNITQAAETEVSLATGEKSNWMYYSPSKLQ